jgi:spore coat polysaccharide biosynthesis protein SpsF
MKCVAVIQARMTSSRLPGKVLLPIGEKSMLQMIFERISRAQLVDEIVVATTSNSSDDSIESEATKFGIKTVRGDEFDVLDRYFAVLQDNPEISEIVRITADCPLVDPAIIDDVISLRRSENADYASNRLPPPWSRTFPLGLDVEVVTSEALAKAASEAKLKFEREHVMPYFYTNPDKFKVSVMDLDEDFSQYRWTVDTEKDLLAVRELVSLCGKEPFSWRQILEVAKKNPWIGEINQDVLHKSVSDEDSRWK